MKTSIKFFKQILSTKITFFFFAIVLLSSCSALIYAFRGPKYRGKFKLENYPASLDGQYFYALDDYSENFDDSLIINGQDTSYLIRNYPRYLYSYVRFDSDGKFNVRTMRRNAILESLPTKAELNALPIDFEEYYVIKDDIIKYEIYTDSYNGYNLYKGRFYGDSIVKWQIGISKMYLTTLKRLNY